MLIVLENEAVMYTIGNTNMAEKFIILGAIALTLVGCGNSPEPISMTPDETYREYHQQVSEGISVENGKRYHSKAFTLKLDAQIKTAQQRKSNSYEDFMKVYFERQQSSAKCNAMTLASETINGKTAELVYHSKSTCDWNKVVDTDGKIRMVYEDGWKVDDIGFTSHRH